MEFEIMKRIKANAPNNEVVIIFEVYLKNSTETIWISGDDVGCAITKEDFISQKNINYDDVLIYENVYEEKTPEDAGKWLPLIKEMMETTAQTYLEVKKRIIIIPCWLPEGVKPHVDEAMLETMLRNCRAIVLYANGCMDFLPNNK